MTLLPISALRQQVGETPLLAAIIAQLQTSSTRETKNGKPYLELTFADSTGSLTLKVWSDSSAFPTASDTPLDTVLRLEGKWTQNAYGIDVRDLAIHHPDAASLDAFFAGDPELLAKQTADFADISRLIDSIADPRLHTLSELFLSQLGDRFRRAAAARKNHHARRGGLVEHVAQMMRSADALCPVYAELNRDLLLAAILFHDSGKLWENGYPAHGFAQSHTLHGEMLGHIPLGIELVNKLWRDLADTPEYSAWETHHPPSEEVRLHLLHLIASHHGEYQFGSPTLPRTPEAYALHHIDNLDAKLEMVRDAYRESNEVAPGILDRRFPLPANLVKPLATHCAPEDFRAGTDMDTEQTIITDE